MTIYAATIFVSAFLLFQVQPLIAKIILPWFGGSAAVWSAALLFFQLMLLTGYAYAHFMIRFVKARTQMAAHVTLLAASCALLPVLPSPLWKPIEAGDDPTLRILALLLATIGMPYFLLSATSPLLQAWYVHRSGSAMPYRLFALSNLGSMLALLTFPFLVEPRLTSRQQAFTWSGAYATFVVLCSIAAWVSRAERSGSTPQMEETESASRPGVVQLLLWVSLSACASTLLVAVTTHLSQDLAPIPLLWVLPLALYLATFIFSFESDRIYRRWIFFPLLPPALIGMAYFSWADGGLNIKRVIPIFACGLFICCMMCHGELARRRPAPRHLTLFYLMVSLGGAVGGLFVALAAPRAFRTYLELPIGLFACALLAVIVLWDTAAPKFRTALVIVTGLFAGYLVPQEYLIRRVFRLEARNFYGVLRVRDERDATFPKRVLLHGTTNHGSQLLADKLRYEPTSYYGPNSGISRAIRALEAQGPIRVGSIGLGVGVLSTYGRAKDVYRIYEINPLVEKIAQTEFTFYAHSPADKRILLGDARLVLERQDSQQFDLLSVDAFSGDVIPIHLLTREAFALYFRHLKPTGILALHISNRYLDLKSVCARGAQFFRKQTVVVEDDGKDASYFTPSIWVLLTSDATWFQGPSFSNADMTPAQAPQSFRAWTDDYNNVFQILKLK